MSNIDKQQYEVVLSASKKDIDWFIEDNYQIEQYTKHRDMLERSIMVRMKANDFNELGKVRIDQVKVFDVWCLSTLKRPRRTSKSVTVSQTLR